MRKFSLLVWVALFCLIAAPFSSFAQGNMKVFNYQANVLDADNKPKEGQVNVTFSIWDSETAGEQVWTEVQNPVIDDGYLNTYLGLISPITNDVFFSKDNMTSRPLWLQVNIDGKDWPRVRLASVPFSLHAIIADTATAALGLTEGALTTEMIADGALVWSKFADLQAGGDLEGTYPNPTIKPAAILNNIPPGSITFEKLAPGMCFPPCGPAYGDLTGSYPDPKIAPAAVTSEKLADGAVITRKIENGAVTNEKIALNTITINRLNSEGAGEGTAIMIDPLGNIIWGNPVAQALGYDVAEDGDVYMWDASKPGPIKWTPMQAQGDVTGHYDDLYVSGLMNRKLMAPTTHGEVYMFDGIDTWLPTMADGDVEGRYDDLQIKPHVVTELELDKTGAASGTFGGEFVIPQMVIREDGRIYWIEDVVNPILRGVTHDASLAGNGRPEDPLRVADGGIWNVHVNADAAIQWSKMAELGDGLYIDTDIFGNELLFAKDPIIGNEILDVIPDRGLYRDGTGTEANPYRVGIADNAITSGMIRDLTIENEDIKDNEIEWTKMKGVGEGLAIDGSGLLVNTGDLVVGNEVIGATANGGLVRSGDGTAAIPYTLGLTQTGVAPAVYGSPTTIPQITVDAHGRITDANNIALTVGGLTPGVNGQAVVTKNGVSQWDYLMFSQSHFTGNAVTSELEIADNAITTGKIIDKAVTIDKIGSEGMGRGYFIISDGNNGAEWVENPLLLPFWAEDNGNYDLFRITKLDNNNMADDWTASIRGVSYDGRTSGGRFDLLADFANVPALYVESQSTTDGGLALEVKRDGTDDQYVAKIYDDNEYGNAGGRGLYVESNSPTPYPYQWLTDYDPTDIDEATLVVRNTDNADRKIAIKAYGDIVVDNRIFAESMTVDSLWVRHYGWIYDLDVETDLDVGGNTHMDGMLDVDGATTLNSTLDVDGATTLNDILDVDGATALHSTLDVDGATTLFSTLDAQGAIFNTTGETLIDDDLHVTGYLDVDGPTTLNNTLDVDGATTLNSTLDVDGHTELNNTLNVDGAATFVSTIDAQTTIFNSLGRTTVDDDLYVTGTFEADGAGDFNSTLNVDGATTLNSTLDADGHTELNNTLNVDGAATFVSTIDAQTHIFNSLGELLVDDDLHVTGYLDVDGPTTLNNTLDVDGATTLNSTLDVDGHTELNNTLNVDGAATFVSTIDAQTHIFNSLGELLVDDDLHVTGYLDVDGPTTLNNTLDVDGHTELNNTLNVDGAATFVSTIDAQTTIFNSLGRTTVDDDLYVTGTFEADGAGDFNSTLNVDGATTLMSTLDVTGATHLLNTLEVDGAGDFNTTLNVDGATTLMSTLDVTGATHLLSTLEVDGAGDFNTTLNVDGAATLNSTLDVDGATTLNNTLDVDGNAEFHGTLEVDGVSTFQDNVYFNGDMVELSSTTQFNAWTGGPDQGPGTAGDLLVSRGAGLSPEWTTSVPALTVTDLTVLNSLDGTTADANFNNLTVHNVFTADGPSFFNDDVTLVGLLDVTGDVSIDGRLDVTGDIEGFRLMNTPIGSETNPTTVGWFSNLNTNSINANSAQITNASIVNADIQELEANRADIDDLYATYSEITELWVDLFFAEIGDFIDLYAVNAEITNAEITNADVTNADIVNADIVNAEITNLTGAYTVPFNKITDATNMNNLLVGGTFGPTGAGVVTANDYVDGTITVDDLAFDPFNQSIAWDDVNRVITITDAGGDVSATLTGLSVFTDGTTIGGDGTSATPLFLMDNAVNSAKIEDGTVALADVAFNPYNASLTFDQATRALTVTDENSALMVNVTNAELSEGAGISSFAYDGSAAATVGIANDGVTSAMILDGSVAIADVAFNPYNTGASFNSGTMELTVSDENGDVTADLTHTHSTLSAGPGINTFSYDGSAPQSVSVDYDANSGLGIGLDGLAVKIGNGLSFDGSGIIEADDPSAVNELITDMTFAANTLTITEAGNVWTATIDTEVPDNELITATTFDQATRQLTITEAGADHNINITNAALTEGFAIQSFTYDGSGAASVAVDAAALAGAVAVETEESINGDGTTGNGLDLNMNHTNNWVVQQNFSNTVMGGRAVSAENTAMAGYGVYAESNGMLGAAVYGESTGTDNFAAWFTSSSNGANQIASDVVRVQAGNPGGSQNYGAAIYASSDRPYYTIWSENKSNSPDPLQGNAGYFTVESGQAHALVGQVLDFDTGTGNEGFAVYALNSSSYTNGGGFTAAGALFAETTYGIAGRFENNSDDQTIRAENLGDGKAGDFISDNANPTLDVTNFGTGLGLDVWSFSGPGAKIQSAALGLEIDSDGNGLDIDAAGNGAYIETAANLTNAADAGSAYGLSVKSTGSASALVAENTAETGYVAYFHSETNGINGGSGSPTPPIYSDVLRVEADATNASDAGHAINATSERTESTIRADNTGGGVAIEAVATTSTSDIPAILTENDGAGAAIEASQTNNRVSVHFGQGLPKLGSATYNINGTYTYQFNTEDLYPLIIFNGAAGVASTLNLDNYTNLETGMILRIFFNPGDAGSTMEINCDQNGYITELQDGFQLVTLVYVNNGWFLMEDD